MSDFGWLSGVGGIMGAVGGWLNNNNNIDAQMEMMRAQMAFNEAEARKNREWQEKMRETSYQTGMSDMKKAGLNPLLAGNIGGAAMPSSAPATSSALPVPAQRNYLSEGISSAVQLLQALNQSDLVDAQVSKTQAETKLVEEQTITAPQQRMLTIAEIEKVLGDTLSPDERRAFVNSGLVLQGAQTSAAHSAAGASAAAARLDESRTSIEQLRASHYDKWKSFPNVDQSIRAGPVSVPPLSQVGGVIRQGWEATQSTTANQAARDVLSLTHPGLTSLKDSVADEIRRMFQGIRRRSIDQSGTDPGARPAPRPSGMYTPLWQRNQ